VSATLTDQQAALFLGKNFAYIATLQKDGWPHLTPVWIDWDGEYVLFNTTVERLKAKHIARDPRVVISVYNADDPYQYVTVSGHAELTTEGAWEHIDKLSDRYRNEPVYRYRDVQRVIVRVRPQRVLASGFDTDPD
jgi:PPOX class probable F420-dependent enzyme